MIQNPSSDSQSNTGPVVLTESDRIENAFAGMGVGIATAGLVTAALGAAAVVVPSLSSAVAVGVTAKQTFAIGALIYDVFAMTVAPLLGLEMEPIE